MAVILTGSEYIDLSAHGAALDIRTRPITVYAEIITTTDDGQFRTIVVHGATAGGDSEYELYLNNGNAHSFWVSATDDYDAGSDPVADGNLHRVALDLSDSFDLLSIVVDADFTDSDALGGDEDTGDFSNETRIGSHPGFSNFIGQISNVAIWNAELDTEELEDLTGGTTDPGDYPSGLLGWWPLDFDARDISGNNRNGTPIGGPDFTEDPPAGEVELEGTTDNAADAHGTLARRRALSGDANTAGDATDAMAVARPLGATTDAAADATGAPSVTRSIAATADTADGATGSLTVRRGLTSATDTAADTTAALAVTRPLTGHGDAASDADGELATSGQVIYIGTGDTAADTIGTLTMRRPLAATGDVAADSTADLTVTADMVVTLTGTMDVASDALSTLTTRRVLSATADAAADMLGDLAESGPPEPVVLPPFREPRQPEPYREPALTAYREQARTTYRESALAAYREPKIPAFREPPP